MLLLPVLVLCRQEVSSFRLRLARLLLLLLRTPPVLPVLTPETKKFLDVTLNSFTEHGLSDEMLELIHTSCAPSCKSLLLSLSFEAWTCKYMFRHINHNTCS
jgi:hypothetical protein